MSGFVRGYCVAICMQLMIEDLIGKERYLKSIDLLWMNDPWWIWAIALLFFALPWERWLKRMDDRFAARRQALADEIIKAIDKEFPNLERERNRAVHK